MGDQNGTRNITNDLQNVDVIEAYTVVVSVTCHIVALVAGGISNIALLVAMCARKPRSDTRKGSGGGLSMRSYTPVMTLLVSCILLCLVWSPLEAADLIVFQTTGYHVGGAGSDTLTVKTALHLFLLTTLAILLVLMGIAAASRMIGNSRCCTSTYDVTSCSSSTLSAPSRRCTPGGWWAPVAVITTLVVAIILTIVYLATYQSLNSIHETSYVDTETSQRVIVLTVTSIAFGLIFLVAVLLVILLLKDSFYWEDGRLHWKRSKPKLVVPDFLISQSNAGGGAVTGEDNAAGSFDPSTASASATPSPSTPKLLAVVGQETQASPVSDLPAAAKSLGSRLGVNMAQVLGRRRHTICQIEGGGGSPGGGLRPGGGGGSGPGRGSNDPITGAKQYGYVRKFSVDVSALQAQLQNPKLFKDAPFQSSVDLAKKAGAENAAAGRAGKGKPEPLMPLKPLPKSIEDKLGGVKTGTGEGSKGSGLGIESSGVANPKGTPPPSHKNGPTNLPALKIEADSDKSSEPGSTTPYPPIVVQTPPQPPPPVIMVSVDEDQPNDNNKEDNGEDAGKVDENTPLNPNSETNNSTSNGNDTTTFSTVICVNDNNPVIDTTPVPSPAAKKPTSLAFKESAVSQEQPLQQRRGSCIGSEDFHEDGGNRTPHGTALDSELSYVASHDEVRDGEDGEASTAWRFSRLVLLLCCCYFVALLPVAVTELLRATGTLSRGTYANTRACVVAVWALQTLVYPHLLIWGDKNLRRAARRLKYCAAVAWEDSAVASCCGCCHVDILDSSRGRHAEDTSSTSQV